VLLSADYLIFGFAKYIYDCFIPSGIDLRYLFAVPLPVKPTPVIIFADAIG
jgi:hypothetical protein